MVPSGLPLGAVARLELRVTDEARAPGLGVLSVMRRFSGQPRVIVVTGFSDRSIGSLASRLGAMHVLHKPVELDHLLSKVLAAAASRRGA